MKKIPKRFKDITFMHSDGGNIKNEFSEGNITRKICNLFC
jgi:hypothetical protein